MKVNKWTAALLSTGVVSAASVVNAEESAVMTALSSTTISGYVDVSGHWNVGTGNANTPAFGFNNPTKADGFNLNAVNLQIGRPMDESQWAAGYNVDLLFGPNAVGYNPSALGDGNESFAIKQAYVDLRAPVGNGLDFKVGVFDTIIGYEVAHSNGNPNYTRSWGWTIEPTQHTGVLASYAFTDMISASFGAANTLTPGINNRAHFTGGPGGGNKAESQKTWLGSIAVTAPEDSGWMAGSTFYGGVVYGYAGAGANQVNYYVGGTMTTPVEGLAVGVAWDYAGANSDQLGGAYHQYVYGLYASYQATEKLSLHGRGEYTKGDLLPATNGEIWSATATIQYDLWANVLSRLEVRWDQGKGTPFGGRASTGGAPSKDNEWLVAANLVYNF